MTKIDANTNDNFTEKYSNISRYLLHIEFVYIFTYRVQYFYVFFVSE